MRLEWVLLNAGLEVIGGYCFDNTGLESLVVPPSLREVGQFAFADCRSLRCVDLGAC